MKTRNDLVNQAMGIENKEARIKFIMNYLLENVKYNYAYLFAKGYAQGTITEVDDTYGPTINKTMIEGDSEISLARGIHKGESKIFNDILSIRDNNSEDYGNFISEIRKYISSELESHINNDTIISNSVEVIIEQIEEGLREKMTINFQGAKIPCNYDISKVLIDFIMEPKKYFPPEHSDGIITNGVCEDYTNYLVPLLQDVGIEAHYIGGTSELGHAWVIACVDGKYKSIDLTRAVFIRDGFKGIPKEQTSDDWLYGDVSKIFDMQKSRSISEVDGQELSEIINGQNYSDEMFAKIIDEHGRASGNTMKSLVKKALEDGVTNQELQDVQKHQKGSEKEKNSNEKSID